MSKIFKKIQNAYCVSSDKELKVDTERFNNALDDIYAVSSFGLKSFKVDDVDCIDKKSMIKSIDECFKLGLSSNNFPEHSEAEEEGEFDDKFIGETIVLLSPMLSNRNSEVKPNEKGVIVGVGGLATIRSFM